MDDRMQSPETPGPEGSGSGDGTPPPLPSLPLRILRVFVAPADLFDRLRERPAWAGALATAAVAAAMGAFLVPPEIWAEVARAGMAGVEIPEGREIPEPPGGFGTFGRWSAVAGALLGTPAAAAVFAGVLLVIFRFLLAREGKYRQHLAVVSHAYLISAVGYLAATPLRLAARDPELTLSVGTFFEPFLRDGFLERLLLGLDLFGIWAWVVVALGMSRLDRRQGWAGAVAILLLLKLAVAAVTAVVRGMGGIG